MPQHLGLHLSRYKHFNSGLKYILPNIPSVPMQVGFTGEDMFQYAIVIDGASYPKLPVFVGPDIRQISSQVMNEIAPWNNRVSLSLALLSLTQCH